MKNAIATDNLNPAAGREVKKIFLLPGKISVAETPTLFTTILGSCVSVCLFDERKGFGGLNHYLFAGEPSDRERDADSWGGPSIRRLIRMMLEKGSAISHIRAKVFGGAQITEMQVSAAFQIGLRNVECALEALAQAHIPIISQDTKGQRGRKLIFESATGKAWVKELFHESQK